MIAALAGCRGPGNVGSLEAGTSTVGATDPSSSTSDASISDSADPGVRLDVGGSSESACELAEEQGTSLGCEFWATRVVGGARGSYGCVAALVANPGDQPVHIQLERRGLELDSARHVTLPREPDLIGLPLGSGGIEGRFADYDPDEGLAPGDLAAVMIWGDCPFGSAEAIYGEPEPIDPNEPEPPPEPIEPHITDAVLVTSDAPIAAYQVNDFSGGHSAIADATLLLPTHAWGTNYISPGSMPAFAHPILPADDPENNWPALLLVADEDDTHISLRSSVDAPGVPGVIPDLEVGAVHQIKLDRGEQLYLRSASDFVGSVIEADRPIGVFTGHECTNVPSDQRFCEHLEEQIPAVSKASDLYVAVPHPPRVTEPREPVLWRVVGMVDGTELTWSTPLGGPATLDSGSWAEILAADPFTVRSQDREHPILLMQYMLGSEYLTSGGFSEQVCNGDPELVLVPPPAQFVDTHVVHIDPTYSHSGIVVIRRRPEPGGETDADGFRPVDLDCLGQLEGWSSVGEFEWTSVSLSANFVPTHAGCLPGVHRATSTGPFSVTVWHTGAMQSANWCVSMAYNTMMALGDLNDVYVPPAG